MSNINIRTDEQVKIDAEKVFEELGLNMSIAINIYLRQVIRERGIPFAVKVNTPNEVTMKAIEEGDKLALDTKSSGYKSILNLKKALDV